jgi:ATP-dependent Lon protease
MLVHFDVGRDKSVAALEEGFAADQRVFFVAQINQQEQNPTSQDCYQVGTIAIVKQVTRMPDKTTRILAEGLERARIRAVLQEEPFMRVKLTRVRNTISADEAELTALARSAKRYLEELADESGRLPPDAVASICEVEDPAQLADIIAANALVRIEHRQRVLEIQDVAKRLETLCAILAQEKQIASLERSVQTRIQQQIEKHNRESYLHEQLIAIRGELGGDDPDSPGHSLRKQYAERRESMPLEAREKVERELGRLDRLHPDSPESGVVQNRLEWILSMPWEAPVEPPPDISTARSMLEEDHHALEKVKQRLIEFLAVRSMSGGLKNPILCLVGPPGVGKTSVAQSVARAMGRPFVRMSLGGMRDEAEIRGHRSTYIGAMPGGLISGVRRAKAANPVFLLDEIDKLSVGVQGDPAAALLEALDPEQNRAFRDLFLDVPFDLSRVMFITTANMADTIPSPLLDRMEMIEIPSYTNLEKLEIARKYLLPKQRSAHGMNAAKLRVTDATLDAILALYTREAGVRELERNIAAICRKAACSLMETGKKSITIAPKLLDSMLGLPKYSRDHIETAPMCGIINGLAYTMAGGSTLQVECAVALGSGKLEITGNLGDVMQESARAAVSFIRSRAVALGLSPDFYQKTDIHIHVPEGAVPKDGPSAGVALTCAIVSALTGRPARQDVAMTGEITLRGRVLPIGGVREKVLAAYRAGVRVVLLPAENLRDLCEVPEQARSHMDIRALNNIDDALKCVLLEREAAQAVREPVYPIGRYSGTAYPAACEEMV